MARVAQEPTPTPGLVFARSLRHLALRDALAAFVSAWRLAFEPSGPVRTRSRLSAAALFLGVIVFVGVGGSLLAGSALVLLGPDAPTPHQLVPGASPTEAVTPAPPPSALPPVATSQPEATDAGSDKQPRSDEASSPGQADQKAGQKRATPEPKEREREKKEKRETPEPGEREREEDDDDDERDDD